MAVEFPWPMTPEKEPVLFLHKSQVLLVFVVQLEFNPVQYFELAENLRDKVEVNKPAEFVVPITPSD